MSLTGGTIVYGQSAEEVAASNTPTINSLVSNDYIDSFTVSGYAPCAQNAGGTVNVGYTFVIKDSSGRDISASYNITGTVAMKVTKRTVSGSMAFATSSVYDGRAKEATFIFDENKGLLNTDQVSISYTDGQNRTDVTDEGFTATATLPKFDGTNSNYIFNDGSDYISAVLLITPKTVTISVNSEAPTSYKYSGEWTNSQLAELFVSPIDINDETLLLAFEITHNGEPATAVQYIGEYNIAATLLESYTNYTAVEVETTLNITAKEITVSAVSGGKTYDGQAAPVSELQALFTVKNAIDENSCADLIVNFSEGEVKDAKAYTVTVVSLPEDYNKMYVLVGGLPSTTYTISPKEIEVDWGETSFEYDGTEKKPAPTAVTGIVGESVTIDVAVQEGSAVNVGTYNATASQSNTNYTLTNTTSVFYITAAALKDLAVSLKNWTYGGTASAPSVTGNTGGGAETVTYSGTAYDGTEYTGSTSAPDRAGKYTVKVSVAASGNYAADSAQSTFEILRATLTDNTVAVKVTYDGAAHGLTIALTGFVKGDSFDTASGKVISYGTKEGNYSSEPVTVTNVSDSKTVYYKAEFHNYFTVESSLSVTVNPLTVVIDWCLNDFTYNGGVQVITATYADVSGSNIPLNVTTYGEFKNAGDYTAEAAFANGETNYALPGTVTKEYSIKKLAVSVQAPSVSVQYGDSVSSLEWQYSGEARFFETVDFEVTTEATATSSVGTYSTVVTPQSFDNYDVTYSDGVLTVTKRIVTLNIEAKSSQYGDPIATLTAVLQEGSSFAGTDTAETVYKLSTTATATSSVGNYDISGKSVNDNYTLIFNNGKSAYEIVKRKVTLSIQPATSVFGDPIAALSATVASGTLVEGDGNVYSLSTAAKSSSAVGGYDITGKIENSNYDITFDGGADAYTITAREIAIVWCENKFTYNGKVQTVTAYYKDINNAEVALAVTIEAGGTVAEFKNAGYYTATAAFAKGETNYILPATVTAAYEIKKAASVIDISGVATVYTYTGEEQTVTGATLNHGETELVYSDNTFTTVAEGNGKTVTITAAESTNYFEASEMVTITVNKLKVDKPSVSVTEFVYDNTEKTLLSAGERFTVAGGTATGADKYTATVSLSDIDNTEWSDGGASSFDIEWEILKVDYDMRNVSLSDMDFEYDGTAHTVTVEGELPAGLDGIKVTVSYNGATVTDVKDGRVTVTATFATESKNYNVPAPIYAYISVYARTVDIVWCANDFTYNGTAQTIAATYADVSGSNIPLNVTTDREFKNAGDYTATAAFAKGETNYALPADKSKEYSIRELEVSVVADDAEMEYGDTPADLTWSYAEGSAEFVETDGITLTVITDANSVSAAGGNYYTHIVEVTLENYIVNYQDGVFSVAPRKITVTIDKKSSVYGAEIAELASSVTSGNIVNGDTDVYSLSTSATSRSDVGNYDITGSVLDTNYNITFEGEKNAYTIGKRAITVTIEGATSVYGDEIAELASAVTDGEIVNGDTKVYSLSTSATNSSNVGEYNINGTVNNLNYDITFEGGTYAYTITAREIAIVWCENKFTYNGGVQAVTAYYKDINNAEVALAVTVKADGAEAEFRNAGDYTATAAFGNGETNYALPATVTAAYNIAKLAVSVVADDAEMQYGSTPANLSWSYAEGSSEFIASDNIELVVSTTADELSPVGAYETAITEAEFENYTVTYAKGVMQVVARKITVTIDKKSSAYGDEIAELASAVTDGEIVNGDTEVYSLSTSATNRSKVGNYDITGSVENANYDITFVGGKGAYTITAREIIIAWCENNFTYNGGVQTVTAYYKDISNSEVALAVTIEADEVVTEFRNAGNYTATASFAYGETNYALPDNATAIYEIKKLEVSVIADNAEMPYGSTPANLTWRYAEGSAEFVASDNVIVEDCRR